MAVTVALFWVSLVLTVIGSDASGELNILHSPPSMKFSGSSVLMESTLKEIYSAALGLSVEENAGWTGLTITNPFATAKAVVRVYVDGISSISDFGNLKGNKYEIAEEEVEPDTYEVTKHRIEQRYTNGDSNLVNVHLNDPNEVANNFAKIGGDIGQLNLKKQSTEHLKYNVVEDMQFLSELAVLRAITEQVKANRINVANNGLDFYNLRVSSLHALSDFHGPNSPATKEAKKLLGMEIEKLASAFEKAYDGAVLVTAVTTDVAHTRRAPRAKRDVSARASLKYSEDYAAIFNIILWFSVVFAFAMIAVVYALVDMDPGRDSIIYRMTSTRMKKDN